MMIPTVVLVLALVASGFSLPLTTQEHVSTENVPQYLTEVPVTQFVEKTGVEGSPETYSSVGQHQQVQINTPVTKVENVPAKVEKPQVSYPVNPVFLPIQPLSVAGQTGQVFRPVIVPAEAITAGRVIIAGIETIQQRNFPPEEVVNVENPVPYQEGVHPAAYTPVQVQGVQPYQQPYFVQTDEKITPVVPTGQEYTPGQIQYNTEPLIREQFVPVSPVPEHVEQVQNYKPVPVENNPQVYSLPQNVQPVTVQSPEKTVPYQVETGYVPFQTVQQSVHEVVEKQGSGYTPVQGHGVEPGTQYQTYTGTSTVTENVEKKVPQQQYTEYQTQGYTVQQGEKQGEYQQQTYTPVQNQQTYVEPIVEKQGHYQTHTGEVQQQGVETTQQGVETQVPVQRVEPVEGYQQVYNAKPVEQIQQTRPVESANQQQIYNAQPVAVDQVQSQVPYQQSIVQEHSADYVSDVKTSGVEHPQQYVQPEQIVTETGYNFGDKIHHPTPVHTLSAVPQTQGTSVQPSVVATQE